jgi:hypothetical protein
MTIHSARNAVPAAEPLQAALHADRPGYFVAFDCGHMGPITDGHRLNPWIEAFLDARAERDAAFAAPHVESPASWVSVAD